VEREASGYSCVLICALGLAVACSGGDAPTGGRTPVGPVGGGHSGAGGGGGTGAIGGFGTGPGTVGGTGGAPVVPPPPVVDASAPPFARDDTAASGLDPATIEQLKQGGAACSTMVTYPYEGTMFPGALDAPIIMWQGGADASYVRISYAQSDKVDYQLAHGASNPGELHIPREAWNEITRRTNNQNLNVRLSVLSGGTVSTCELHFRVAPGNMVGALYYNTYQAPPPGVPGQGAVMRLSLGTSAEIYKQHTGPINLIPATGPCISCHSVSFNGTTMVASYHDYQLKRFEVERYDVGQGVQPPATGRLHNANFGALTPDGSRILAMGNPQCTGGSDTFARKPNNFPLVEGADVARMIETATDQDTNAQGLNPEHYMWMPQFSPNGDKIVCNHAKPDGSGGTDRRELAVMDYDYATNTFSNLRVVVSTPSMSGVPAPSAPYSPAPAGAGPVPCGVNGCNDQNDPNVCSAPPPLFFPGDVGALPTGSCTGPCYPAWPFFTPDGRAVIFSLTSEPDFANAFPGRDVPASSDLWYVDLETREVVRLDNANRGRFPADERANYYPTVMPVAVGGYFWVFWTSVRDYGHKVVGRGTGGGLPSSVLEADKKRIWAAAIKSKADPTDEVTATPGPLTDPSFPGFYIEGQSESGNVRAFAALNPCLPNGESCMSGLDCCCGYCLTDANDANGTCNCEPPPCSKLNEKCETSADCCPPTAPDMPKLQCLGGFCGFIVVE
jgi:hypothetical protein